MSADPREAAGLLLVREAGGAVFDFDGSTPLRNDDHGAPHLAATRPAAPRARRAAGRSRAAYHQQAKLAE
jgi:fructose-1,6-bisphosphatase/inositol monophosphatase family enzyme